MPDTAPIPNDRSGGHHIRTEVRSVGISPHRLTYHASCACGWHSTACKDVQQASQQAVAHLAMHTEARSGTD